MAYVQIWVHAVWGTKRRAPVMHEYALKSICDHITMNAKSKGVYLLAIGGHNDHVHALMALKSDWSIAKQMQMIKGEAAHWINQENIVDGHFEWADEYFAASVSRDKLEKVIAYIGNQATHHQKVTFQQEYALFLKDVEINRN